MARSRPRSCCATCSTTRRASRSRCRPGGSCSARSSGPRQARLQVMIASRARVLPVPRVLRRGRGEGLRGPHAALDYVLEDYHILQTTKDEYLIRADPQRHGRRGRARRVLEGRGRAGPARDQPRYADAVEMADRHVVYKNGAKEIAALARAVDHVHGEVRHRRGRLVVPHPLEPVVDRRRRRRAMADASKPDGLSDVVPMAGSAGLMAAARELSLVLRAVRQLLQALPARVVGADRGRVGRRQPHAAGSASSATATALPGRVPHPRRRRQPLPRVRGDDRRRPPRHRAPPRAGRPFVGNGYTAADLPPRAAHSRRRDRAVRGLRAGAKGVRRRRARPPAQHREAGVGWFNQHVTDWELRRGFERL